ncbi:MAG: hypothetical protein ABSC47_12865, partial [Terracidiphilus sp.]
MRFIAALLWLGLAASSRAQSVQLPDAPQPSAGLLAANASVPDSGEYVFPVDPFGPSDLTLFPNLLQASQSAQDTNHGKPRARPNSSDTHDANGNPIPLERRQPKRILGIMPNFRSVAGGAVPHPPGWKYNFIIATHQATDYSSFIFLGITSLTAEGVNEHPVLGKGVDGFYAYTWRGFLDKTDGTYLSAWLLPNILREDTRFFALGSGHRIVVR